MIKKLPDAELEVMQAIWSCESPVKRSEIDEILKESHPMAQTTLLTLLTRLSDKGFIQIEKVNRSSVYIPLIKEEDYIKEQSKTFFHKLCKGNISVFANALCSDVLSEEDINELKEWLEREES